MFLYLNIVQTELVSSEDVEHPTLNNQHSMMKWMLRIIPSITSKPEPACRLGRDDSG